MHIASHGIVARSIFASFCGNDYACYPDNGGTFLVIARRSDRKTTYLQDDVAQVEHDLDIACKANPDDECGAVDRILSEYDAIEDWDAFDVSHCAPSSDLMLLNYF